MGRDKRPGPVAPHIRIDLSLLRSPAFIALDWTARALFVDLRSRMGGFNNGDISAPLSELKHRGWASSTTLAKALRQLEAVGLLRKTRKTIGVDRGSKLCNLYRFTDIEVFERKNLGIDACKATDDYKAFKTLAEARRAVSEASTPKKKTALQELHRDAAETAPMGASGAADAAVTTTGPTAETGAPVVRRISRKANTHAGVAHLDAEIEVMHDRLQILHTTT
ncbi:hypothetical protein LJR260_003516 [Variovorax paradoxus]|uniref:hypothetical protein n=1 Tax=Variovorax paradoxus TaxID=34073 RepID=UPI00339891D7